MNTGKLAGLYPDNAVNAALADEILDSCEDLASVFSGALAGKEKEEDLPVLFAPLPSQSQTKWKARGTRLQKKPRKLG